MANVIEILINAKNNASTEFEKATKGLQQFASIAGIAGAAGAAAGQAIMGAMQGAQQAIVSNTLAHADLVEMLDRMSSTTGISVQRLDLFRQQLEADGLSSDQLSQALRYLREQINSGNKELEKYGITSRDSFTALQQMAQAMQRARDVGERAAISTAALGMRSSELAGSIAEVARNMDGAQADAMRNGTALTDEYLTKMRELDKSMDEFAKTQKSFGMASAEFFQPLIKGAADALTGINRMNSALREMDSQINKVPGLRAGMSMQASHSSDYSDPAGYMAGIGAGGGGGGGGGSRSGRVTTWANPYDPNASGMGIMARLPEAIMELATALKLTMGGPGGAGDASGKTMDSISKPLDAIHSAAMRLGQNLEGTFRSAFSSILAITSSSTNMVVQLFTALANGILQTISDMLAEAAARGLIDFALSFATGGTSSAAAKVGSVFKSQPLSAARSTGDTFVIQAIDARSAMDDIMNPTGSLRRANDRVRDIAIAQAG